MSSMTGADDRSGETAHPDWLTAHPRWEEVAGLTLVASDGPHHADGLAMLATAREAAVQERFTMPAAWMVGLCGDG